MLIAKTKDTKVKYSLQSVMLKPIAVPFAAKISIVSFTSFFMSSMVKAKFPQ